MQLNTVAAGGGFAGGPPDGGGAPPGAEGPPADAGAKAAAARATAQELASIVKIAADVKSLQRSGKMRIKEARPGTPERAERDEVKNCLKEMCGLR